MTQPFDSDDANADGTCARGCAVILATEAREITYYQERAYCSPACAEEERREPWWPPEVTVETVETDVVLTKHQQAAFDYLRIQKRTKAIYSELPKDDDGKRLFNKSSLNALANCYMIAIEVTKYESSTGISGQVNTCVFAWRLPRQKDEPKIDTVEIRDDDDKVDGFWITEWEDDYTLVLRARCGTKSDAERLVEALRLHAAVVEAKRGQGR